MGEWENLRKEGERESLVLCLRCGDYTSITCQWCLSYPLLSLRTPLTILASLFSGPRVSYSSSLLSALLYTHHFSWALSHLCLLLPSLIPPPPPSDPKKSGRGIRYQCRDWLLLVRAFLRHLLQVLGARYRPRPRHWWTGSFKTCWSWWVGEGEEGGNKTDSKQKRMGEGEGQRMRHLALETVKTLRFILCGYSWSFCV